MKPNYDIIKIGEAIHDALRKLAIEHQEDFYSIGQNLSGACAVSSYFLMQHVKKRLGLKMNFMASGFHAWTQYKSFVYDPTFCQFDPKASKVHVIPVADKDDHYAYRHDVVLLSRIQRHWPEYQQPRNYRLRWNRNGCKIQLAREVND